MIGRPTTAAEDMTAAARARARARPRPLLTFPLAHSPPPLYLLLLLLLLLHSARASETMTGYVASFAPATATAGAAAATTFSWQRVFTSILAAAIAFLFLRSAVPRIPQLFLRGRLRVKRAGLRGVRGIEWHSSGFAVTAPSRSSRSSSESSSGEGGGESSDAGNGTDLSLVVKIRHVYFTFRRRVGAAKDPDKHHDDGEDTERETPASAAWITLHIDGVGITLPRETEKEKQGKANEARKKAEAARQARRRSEEEHEERLQQLMEERPPSPALGGFTRPLSPIFGGRALSPARKRSDGPPNMPAFSAVDLDASLARAQPAQQEDTSSLASILQDAQVLLTRAMIQLQSFIRFQLVPAAIYIGLGVSSGVVYLVASLLPLLTAIVDLEIHGVEVYSAEADVVLRAKRITLGAHSEVVSPPSPASAGCKASEAACGRISSSFRERFSDKLASVHGRIGSGAKGAAYVIRERLPAVRANLQITMEGFQAFDAHKARQRAVERSGNYKPNHTAEAKKAPMPPPSPPRVSSTIHAVHDQQWLSFADAAESDNKASASPPAPRNSSGQRPILSHTKSVEALQQGGRDNGTNARWTGRWADWTLEQRPNASFIPSTSWSRNAESAQGNATISPSARMIAMPSVSLVKLGLGLGRSVARESLHVSVNLAPVMLGADALSGVTERLKNRTTISCGSQSDEEISTTQTLARQQKSSSLVRTLETFGSVSLRLPSVTVDLSSKASFAAMSADTQSSEAEEGLPSSLQVTAELTDLSFSLRNSDPRDVMHHRWVGTCGIRNYRHPRAARGLSSTFRWPGGKKATSYYEHRRVFQVDCGIRAISVRMGVDGQHEGNQSLLLKAEELSGTARSSWTPAGVLFAQRPQETSADPFFRGDPNEAATIIETKAKRVTGDLKLRHLTALVCFIESKRGSKPQKGNKVDKAKQIEAAQGATISNIPRFAYHGELHDVTYRLDAMELFAPQQTSGPSSHLEVPEFSLNLKLPRALLSLQSSYSGQYIRRSDSEKRSAWKALERDELEWSLRPQKSERGVPRVLSQEMRSEMHIGSQHEEQDEKGADCRDSPSVGEEDQQDMTMAEAIQEMHRIQQNGKARTNKRRFSGRRTRPATDPDQFQATDLLKVDYICAFDSLTLHWVTTCDASTSPRSKDDVDAGRASPEWPSRPSTKADRRFVKMNAFEASGQVCVPGIDAYDCVELYPLRSSVDARISLEEFDLDLWNAFALEALRNLLSALRTRQPRSHNTKEGNTQEPREGGATTSSVPEIASPEGPPTLLELLRIDASVYFSIGTIVAHIGGIDERCDKTTARGVGIDIKRIIFQFVCYKCEQRKGNEALRMALGSRSALDLPEDLRASVGSMALRNGKAASAKVNVFAFGVFPLLDAQVAVDQHAGSSQPKSYEEEPPAHPTTAPGSPSIIAPAVWEFQKTRPEKTSSHRTRDRFRQQDRSNFMIWMPSLTLRANLTPKKASIGQSAAPTEELQVVSEDIKLLSFKIELLHTYCLLVAASSMKTVFANSQARNSKNTQPKKAGQGRQLPFAKPCVSGRVDIGDVHMAVTLPSDVRLFILLQRTHFCYSSAAVPSLGFEWLMAAVESPEKPSTGAWEEMARIRDCLIRFDKSTEGEGPERTISVNADGLNLHVPFGYTVHPIIDSTVVAVKATKQLLHQFLLDSNESVITPVAEAPKHLPIIKFEIRTFALEAQDDPFETRLNIIWRSGGDENQARAERDAAFETKLQALKRQNKNASQVSFTSTDSASTSDSSDEGDAAAQRAAAVTAENARRRLDAFNASSWIRRFTNARAEQARREDAAKRRIYGRLPVKFDKHANLPIKLNSRAKVSPLFRSTMSKLRIQISPPSFPEPQLLNFLHEQGKGVPVDMEYSLLVPMRLSMEMAEWKIDLRDYPMPLLHFPPIDHPTQAATTPGVEVSFDCVIAEQLGSHEALRHLPAIVVPASTGRSDAIEYGISVPRMAMPTKFFGSPVVNVNSSFTSRVVWGQSIQPAISDCIRVLEGITSPPQDPSPRIGFWDKLSLIMQGRVLFRFNGQFHLYLKGSREPYHILGHGAGWVKCWRGQVEVRVGFENKDHEVFQIISDEYLLAIPDLKDYIDRAATGTENQSSDEVENVRSTRDRAMERKSGDSAPSLASSHHRYMKEPDFKKVCLKLTNGVRWGSALVLERTCTDETCQQPEKCRGDPFYRECRFWARKPHWEVYTRSQEFVETLPEEERGDSFENWRSHHLHFSISVTSPMKRDHDTSRQTYTPGDPEAVNNFYFTPLAWEHFWAWMRLFDGTLGLPIRQGKLFPGSLEQSPKFGRHLGTLKYRFDIAPLFISHVYPQDNTQDWAHGRTTLLGIKSRMTLFHLDFHQRQTEMIVDRPELGGQRKKFHKPFYEAEVDLSEINFRTIAGRFNEPDKRLFPQQNFEADEAEDDQSNIFGDQGGYALSDSDLEWYDLNDFVELDWAPPEDNGRPPCIKLMEAMNCPRFNYYRRIESKRERGARTEGSVSSEDVANLEHTKFGREKTHTCLVGTAPFPPKIQEDLSNERLRILRTELDEFLKGGRGQHGANDREEGAARTEANLRKNVKLVEEYIALLRRTGAMYEKQANGGNDPAAGMGTQSQDEESNPQYSQADVQEWHSFDNRYFIHNPIIFYSNATRDVLLKYYLSSRKRRGVVHSLSARAVRYIRNFDLGDNVDGEQDRKSESESEGSGAKSDSPKPPSHANVESEEQEATPKMLRDLLNEARSFIGGNANGQSSDPGTTNLGAPDPHSGISDDYNIQKSNVCIFVKPQIVFRSLIDDKSTLIITATRARLHNYCVIDPKQEEDSVNQRVLHRNFIGVDGLQAFHPTKTCIYLEKAEQRFGFIHVPLETLIDLRHTTTDFDRVAPRTDATIHYDKFNKLRLSDPSRPVSSMRPGQMNRSDETKGHEVGSDDHLCHTMDLIRLHCSRYSISANADQFTAIYNIVTDLLLYRDPAYREHAKKLETMHLSYDFTNVQSLADIVQALQVRVRHARELHAQYHLHFDRLNEQGRLDFLSLKAEVKDMQEELNLLLEAITSSGDSSDKEKKLALRIDAQAQDIGWNMMGQEESQLLAKLSIKGVNFTWLNKADNSVANTLSIADLYALNVHPEAVFAEIITKYQTGDHPMKQKGMLLNAMWSVLAPVGGISIVDHFELNLHPLRIQLEHRIGRQIEEYVFGGVREKRREKEAREQRRRQIEGGSAENGQGDSSQAARKMSSPFKRLALAVRGGGHRSAEQTQEPRKVGERPQMPRKSSDRLSTGSVPRRSSDGRSFDAKSSTRKSFDKRRTISNKSSSKKLNGANGESWTSSPGTPVHSSANSTYASVSATGSGAPGGGTGAGAGTHSDDESEENGQQAIAARNAVEMRERASRTVTFVYFKLSETIFCLSYKSEKQRSITDLYDLVFRSPRLEYRNRTWAHADLANHLKRDIFRAAWSQKSTLLKSVINHRRPPTGRVAAAAITLTRSRQSQNDSSKALITNPFDRALAAANNAAAAASDPGGKDTDATAQNDDAETAVPQFQLHVDPPSFDEPDEGEASDNDDVSISRSSLSSNDDQSSMHGFDDFTEHAEGDSASDAAVVDKAGVKPRRRPLPPIDQHKREYEGGDQIDRDISSTGSNSSGRKTRSSRANKDDSGTQHRFGRILAKTLQRGRDSISSDPQGSSPQLGGSENSNNGSGAGSSPSKEADSSRMWRTDSESVERRSSGTENEIATSYNIRSSEEGCSGEAPSSPPPPPPQQQQSKQQHRRRSSTSFGLDHVMDSVRRARDRMGSPSAAAGGKQQDAAAE